MLNLFKRIKTFIPTILIVTLVISGCNKSKSTVQPKSITDTNSVPTNLNTAADSLSVFDLYDIAKKLTNDWNNAIDGNNPQTLNSLYADTVSYYVKIQSKKDCIDSKTKWLSAHADYQQKIVDLEVYYEDDDTTGTKMFSKFAKLCIEKGDTQKIYTYLRFIKTTDGWKIDKETDQPSNVSIAKKAPVSNLKPGEYLFRYGYWTDTRDIPDFAHDEVPYWQSISLNIGQTITGEYSEYSGTLRSIMPFLIPEGKIENGILTITSVYNEMDEMTLETYNPDEVSESIKQQWKFKIVNGNELVNMNEDDFRYGESLYLDIQKK